MSIYKLFETDKKLETEGIELRYETGDIENDFSIFIRRAGSSNLQYQKLIAKKVEPHRLLLSKNQLPLETMLRITAEVYSETVVIGWHNVKNKNGEIIPFSAENCLTLFLDMPDFFEDIRAQAENANLFRKRELEDAAKN